MPVLSQEGITRAQHHHPDRVLIIMRKKKEEGEGKGISRTQRMEQEIRGWYEDEEEEEDDEVAIN